ncbi:hypothetical protein AAF712_016137 [Marasmius tenuissimus]|uniref:Uncharacterized protein n=1 Tax=Marasmius tenuissimus TaxID=585030 RepID=A0ABR2Z7L5_9AGAR
MLESEAKEVALPPSRPLKRSASTASLPTPPRTLRRRRNAKSRRAAPVSSDDDSDVEEKRGRAVKRRKISSIREEDEDQEAFWAADDDRLEQGSTKPKSTMSEPEMSLAGFDESDSETTSFLSRRRFKQSASSTGSAPVSPPPSYRRPRGAKVVNIKTTRQLALKAVVEEREEGQKEEEKAVEKKEDASPGTIASPPPATPKTPKAQIRSGISPMMLLRDSPDNPFLSSPESPSGTGPSTATVAEGRGKGAVFEEQPFVQMVFRGVRKTYPNPYYDHKRGRPKSPDPNSLLPPEHPDYSPDLRGQPKVLWPTKKSKAAVEEPKTPTKKPLARTTPAAAAASLKTPPQTKKRTTGKTRNLVDSDDEDEDEKGLDEDDVLPVRPLRLFTEKSS